MRRPKKKNLSQIGEKLRLATEAQRQSLFESLVRRHKELMDGIEESSLDTYAVYAWGCAWRALRAGHCARHCESPLEVMLLGELLRYTSPPATYLCPLPEVSISSQRQIGSYRVDFLIETHDATGREVRIVVEVDGHDFHERTKEQAQRDKERDRFLVSSGFVVMRFTGREVFKNARKCADEVGDYIEQRHQFAENCNG